jgi:ABC-type transporter Mla MlaB component
MLRITRRPDEALRLEGRLTRYEVALLRESLRAAPNGFAFLDLSDLAFVDERGAALLVELRQRGVELRGASPFVRRLVEEVSA